MNHKNERILKLFERGIKDAETIAKKTGLSLERVKVGLQWLQGEGRISK